VRFLSNVIVFLAAGSLLFGQAAPEAAAPARRPDTSSSNAPSRNTPSSNGPSSSTLAPVATDPYEPITGEGRIKWWIRATGGPSSIAASMLASGISTKRNSPEEYGPHWEGYGKRLGLRMADKAVSNAIEGGLGAIWGEDPRYRRAAGQPFGSRVTQILKLTVLAEDREGHPMPAYARYVAYPGKAALSNLWHPDSENSSSEIGKRVMFSFLGKLGSNALKEFWPDVRQHLHHRSSLAEPSPSRP